VSDDNGFLLVALAAAIRQGVDLHLVDPKGEPSDKGPLTGHEITADP
jgi:hypothetical protein